MTGYSREEVIGRNCRFLQGPDTDQDTVARIREVVGAGGDLTVKVRLAADFAIVVFRN